MAPNEISDPLQELARQPVDIKAMTELHLVMGSQCNVRCKFCYQATFSPKDNLNPDVVTGLLPLMGNLTTLVIQGGEPTVMKACKQLRDYLMETPCDATVTFLTNGVLFKDEWIDFALKKKITVHFSINASSKERYNEVVQYGDFDAAITNLKTLVARRNEQGEARPYVRTSFVIFEKSLWDILDFFKLVHGIGVDGCSFYIDCRRPSKALFEHMSAKELDAYHNYLLETIDYIKSCNFHPNELLTLDYIIKGIKSGTEYIPQQEACIA